VTRRPSFGRLPESKMSLGFKLWFAFCAAVALAVLGVGFWLAMAAIDWLNRN
jgi:hypothetical protein